MSFAYIMNDMHFCQSTQPDRNFISYENGILSLNYIYDCNIETCKKMFFVALTMSILSVRCPQLRSHTIMYTSSSGFLLLQIW